MSRRGHVMAPLESIVGRAADLERIVARLDEARLCCITGPVGVGKTLAARAVASGLRFPGGVFWCDTSAASSPDSLDALVEALAVPLGAALLVLDDADAFAPHLHGALPLWLGEHPERKALVTSRERPGIAGEAVVILEPLDERDGVALFIQRASALDDRFDANAEARTAIASIVRLLDGLPLAIELAAAQTLVLSPVALLAHLESAEARLDARGRGDSLRQAIGAAWSLLPSELASVMIGCSVFEGAFTFAAAGRVVGADIASLQALCERSFVHSFDVGGARCFRIYASLRDYARSHGIDEQIRQRHRACFLATLAGRTEPLATRLNLIASAEHDVATGAHARALETLVAATSLVLLQGPVAATLALLDRAWSAVAEPSADALCARGRLRVLDGQLSAAAADLEHALRRAAADSPLRAVIFAEIANVARQRGHATEAAALYEQGLAEPAAEPAVRAQTLERLAGHLFEQGDMILARSRLRDAEEAYATNIDAQGLARVQHAKGCLEQEAGDLAAAARCFHDAEQRHRELGNDRFSAIARFDQGALLLEQGSALDAQRVLHEAVTRLEGLGDRRQALLGRALLGVCAARLGDVVAARALLDRAQAEADAVGDDVFSRAVRVHRGHLHLSRSPSVPSVEPARSDEERYALRVLARSARLDADTVAIARDGSFVASPTGERSPVRSKAAQRILAQLVVAHESGPDASVSATELFRVGWPGERVLDEAAKNRVHVALSSLRSGGLGERLSRTAAGYRLEGPLRVLEE